MNFMHPEWLLLLLLVPVVYYIYTKMEKKKKALAVKFSSLGIIKQAAGTKKIRRNTILFILNALVLAMLALALADPHLPLEQSKQGVNVVVVLDVSGSMQATDYQPNRIEAAKASAKVLISHLQPSDYAGIVIFSDGATTASYLTPFKDKAIEKLESISAREGRTAIGDGLSLAVDMATSVPNKKKVIVLLSDGVNNAGVVSPQEAVLFAKSSEIQVYAIGMGSSEPVVLGYDFFGNPQMAELDEETLRMIATETGGEYYKSVNDQTLGDIYSKLPEKIKREKELASIKDWFILAIIVLLLIEFYLRYVKYKVIS